MSGGHPARPKSVTTIVVVALIVVLLLGTGGLVGWKLLGGRVRAMPDRALEVFPLDARTYERGFGYGEVDVQCRQRCAFSFRYGGGRAVLHYAIGHLEDREALEIQVNGKAIGFAPPAPKRLIRGIEVVLPRGHLRQGAANQVAFVQRKPAAAPWTVVFVWVDEEPLPQPNLEKARELRDLAYKKFGEKDVAFGNLFQSITYLRSARDYVESYEPKPEIYDEVSRKADDISRELQEQFDKLMFSARKASQFGDRQKAMDILTEKVLKYFPDADDARHQEARQAIEALKE